MKKKRYDIFLITGGTAGHVFPAKSLSDYLLTHGVSNLIVTDHRGLKYISNKNNEIKKIQASHLDSKKFKYFFSLIKIITGFLQFIFLFIQKKPKNIITFGGYVSFAPLLTVILLRKIIDTNIYFHEQNAVIGDVHKKFLFSAKKIFLTFEHTKGIDEKYFKNTCYSGIPIRKEIKKYSLTNYNFQRKRTTTKILIFGGSQGSSNLSYKVLDIFKQLSKESKSLIQISIQCPEKDYINLKSILKETNINYEIKTFYENMIEKISKTDLCICRSGSSTLNEIKALNTPSILVPFPYSKNNHQYYNAKTLSDKRCAILIEEKDFNTKRTLNLIENIILNPNLLTKMFKKLYEMPKLNSNDIIFKNIYSKINEQ